jgi:hypothetical protein
MQLSLSSNDIENSGETQIPAYLLRILAMAERGDYTAAFFATLFVSVTSPVIPAFSVVYCQVSAVACVSAMPSSLSYGHRKCPKKVT